MRGINFTPDLSQKAKQQQGGRNFKFIVKIMFFVSRYSKIKIISSAKLKDEKNSHKPCKEYLAVNNIIIQKNPIGTKYETVKKIDITNNQKRGNTKLR